MVSVIKHPFCLAWDVLNVPVSQNGLYRRGRFRSCTPRWGVQDPNAVALSYLCGLCHETWRRGTRNIAVGAAQGSSDGHPTPSISEAEPAGRRGSANGAKSPKKIHDIPGKSRATERAGLHAQATSRTSEVASSTVGGEEASDVSRGVAEELVSVSRSGRQSSRTKTVKPMRADEDGDDGAVEVVLAERYSDDAETSPVKSANPKGSRAQKGTQDERECSSSGGPEENPEHEDVPAENRDSGANVSGSKRAKASSASAQPTTVRMVRLPGGRLVDPRTVKGWVILPDGRKVVCGRCGGRSVLKFENMEEMDCPACFPFREMTGSRRGWRLTPEHRQKISAANKGKTLREDVKERISKSMQEVYASGEQQARISAATSGKPKTCTVCGQAGHNRSTCPQLQSQETAASSSSSKRDTAVRQGGTGGSSKAVPRPLAGSRSSRYKGVSWSKENKKWRAQCWTGSTVHLIGYFNDEDEAARAFDVYVLETKGLGAQINFDHADYGIEVPEPEPEEAAPLPGPSRGSESPGKLVGVEGSGAATVAGGMTFPLPMTRDDIVREAVLAICRARADGVRRQRVEFPLPQNGKLFEASGWPGGIRQQFVAARGLVESVLLDLKRLPDLQGSLSADWLDEADCVGAWQSDSLAAVLFPSSEALPRLRALDSAQGGQRLTLFFNPQWQTDGQIVSDFGFGKAKREAEAFVYSFTDVFVMERRRINGDEVYLYKAYPGPWQLHFMWPNGKGHLLAGAEAERPSYDRILDLLRRVPGSQASQSWLDRISATLRAPPAHLIDPPAAAGAAGGRAAKGAPVANREVVELDPGTLAWEPGSSGGASRGVPQGPPSQKSPSQKSVSQRPSRNGNDGLQPEGFGEEAMLMLEAGNGEAAWEGEGEEAEAARRRREALEIDIITGQPVRDIRMEPVLQMARWQKAFFGGAGGPQGPS